jgi:protein required for attachment to host cells
MKRVYVVLANSTSANFYMISEKKFSLELIKRIHHSESRLKERALDADRPGNYQKGFYGGRGVYAEPKSHKDLEVEGFAKEICKELERERIEGNYIGIIIVANPHFYGLINTNATRGVREMIKFHLLKDYVHYSEKKLTLNLKETLAHEIRNILIA